MSRSTGHDQSAGAGEPGRRLFAALYDPITAAAERTVTGPHRAELLTQAAGAVLEVDAGCGADLPHYRPGQVSRLVVVEPDPHMRRRLQTKLTRTDPSLRTAGLQPDQVRHWAFPGPLSRLLPVVQGTAVPREPRPG